MRTYLFTHQPSGARYIVSARNAVQALGGFIKTTMSQPGQDSIAAHWRIKEVK